jgi:acetyltransferase-like isoleucine patch superfamily enzyme
MGGKMISVINLLITKIKKEEFVLDANIPSSYIIAFIIERLLMMLRGMITLGQRNVYIGRGVNVKCKRMLSVGNNVKFDNGTHIDALSTHGVNIGDNVNIGKYCRIEATGSLTKLGHGLVIEDGVGLNSNCFIGCAGGVHIGQDTIIGELVTFHSENHNFTDISIAIKLQGINRQGIRVGAGCWIGAKVTVLDGAIVEDGCVIAAGSVVTAGVYTSNNVYAGVPAKLIKKR